MISNTEIVNLFNSRNFKRIIRVKEMVANKDYFINGAYRTTTKYGEAVVIELEEGIVYLPKRFNIIENDVLQEISNGSFSITKIASEEDAKNLNYKLELREQFISNTYFTSY